MASNDTKKAIERFHHLFGFLLCMKGRNFNKLLISILKYAEDTHHLYDSDRESLTIKKLIESREHIYIFCDEVINIFNCWATSMIKLRKKLLDSILEILRSYAQTTTKGRTMKAQNELENYRMMILCGIYDIGQFKSLIRRDVEDQSMSNKVFYSYMNKVFEKARNEKVSIQSILLNSNKKEILIYESTKATAKYDKNSTEWIGAVNDDYNHVEMMDYAQKEANLKKDNNTIVNNKSDNDNDTNPRQQQPIYPNTYRPRGRGRGRYRNRGRGGRGRHQRGYNNEAANRFTMSKNYLQSIQNELKDIYKSKLTNICGYYHAPGVNCTSQVDGENKCKTKSGKIFNHNCVCGKKHRLFTCRDAWK